MSLTIYWFSFGFLGQSRKRKYFGRVFMVGLELLENLEVFEFIVGFPSIFGIRVTENLEGPEEFVV